MRDLTDRTRVEQFMVEFGRYADQDARVYFTGGATAVLYGWRDTTIDVDIKLVPAPDALLRHLPSLKERLSMNIELAAPSDFLPVREDWEQRSPFIAQHGRTFFHHFDLHAQALAKIERDHTQDRRDVHAMLTRGLITGRSLVEYFDAIAPLLYRYPALDPPTFRTNLERTLEERATQ